MSMLDRYRKPGGFLQLLALIEACPISKQEKLLEVVALEDLRWSETVRAKMLSIDRIYGWNDETLAEIFGALQDLTVAVALSVAPADFKNRITGFFAQSRLRKIDELLSSKGATPAEVSSTHLKIIEAVRKMGTDGFLRFEKIDPALVVLEGIDDFLAQQPAMPSRVQSQPPTRLRVAPSPVAENAQLQVEVNGATIVSTSVNSQLASQSNSQAIDSNESRVVELQNLKKRVADLSKENATLRHDLSLAKSKLDQIKKIA